MQEHPVPQNVTSFEFKLIGDMTLRQFGYVGTGLGFALIFFFAPLPNYIRFPFIILFPLIGFALAFMPIEGRPLDRWLVSFIRAVFGNTLYVWKKEGVEYNVLNDIKLPEVVAAKPVESNFTFPLGMEKQPKSSAPDLDFAAIRALDSLDSPAPPQPQSSPSYRNTIKLNGAAQSNGLPNGAATPPWPQPMPSQEPKAFAGAIKPTNTLPAPQPYTSTSFQPTTMRMPYQRPLSPVSIPLPEYQQPQPMAQFAQGGPTPLPVNNTATQGYMSPTAGVLVTQMAGMPQQGLRPVPGPLERQIPTPQAAPQTQAPTLSGVVQATMPQPIPMPPLPGSQPAIPSVQPMAQPQPPSLVSQQPVAPWQTVSSPIAIPAQQVPATLPSPPLTPLRVTPIQSVQVPLTPVQVVSESRPLPAEPAQVWPEQSEELNKLKEQNQTLFSKLQGLEEALKQSQQVKTTAPIDEIKSEAQALTSKLGTLDATMSQMQQAITTLSNQEQQYQQTLQSLEQQVKAPPPPAVNPEQVEQLKQESDAKQQALQESEIKRQELEQELIALQDQLLATQKLSKEMAEHKAALEDKMKVAQAEEVQQMTAPPLPPEPPKPTPIARPPLPRPQKEEANKSKANPVSDAESLLDIVRKSAEQITAQPAPIEPPERPVSSPAVKPVPAPVQSQPPTQPKQEVAFDASLPALTKIPNAVSGYVFDDSGKPLIDTVIVVKKEKGPTVRALKTNRVGQFSIVTSLPQGKYEISFEKEGYTFNDMAVEAKDEVLPPIKVLGKKVS